MRAWLRETASGLAILVALAYGFLSAASVAAYAPPSPGPADPLDALLRVAAGLSTIYAAVMAGQWLQKRSRLEQLETFVAEERAKRYGDKANL